MSALRLQMSGGRERRGSPIGVKNKKVINLPARWNKSAEVTRVQTETRKPDSLQEVENSGSNMTISDSNKDTIVIQHFELCEMVPLSEVVRFSWDARKAERLRVLRGKMSRQTTIEELAKLNCNYSTQYLADLEYGKGDSIAADLLLAICKVFGVKLSHFVPTARVETETTKLL